MAFDPAEGAAILTTLGSDLINRMDIGVTLDNWSFAVGSGGHNAGVPQDALEPLPAQVALAAQTWPAVGTEPVDAVEQVSATAASFLCRLEDGEAVGLVSEWGLFAEVTASNVPAEIGTTVLIAYMTHPLHCKVTQEQRGARFILQQ